MRLYYKTVLLLFFIVGLMFFIGPLCISIDSTPILIGFCITIILVLPAIFKFAYQTIKEIYIELQKLINR